MKYQIKLPGLLGHVGVYEGTLVCAFIQFRRLVPDIKTILLVFRRLLSGRL